MAPTETNHGSGDVGARPNPPERHQPAAEQTEQHPESISLPQTPETAQRAFKLTDNDHPDINVGNTSVVLANGASGSPAPYVPFLHSPPRPEARLTPPLPPTGLGPTPAWNIPVTEWLGDQGPNRLPIIQIQTRYPPDAPSAPGAPGPASAAVVPAPEGEEAIGLGLTLHPPGAPGVPGVPGPEEEVVGGDGATATCGGQASSSSSSSSGTE